MAAGFRSFFARWMGGGASSFPAPTDGTLIIAGVDRLAWLKHDTGRFRRAFNQRSQFTCVLEDDQNRGYTPLPGSNLIVLLGSTRLFGGIITRVTAERDVPSDNIRWNIEATDYSILADKRVIYYDGLLKVISFPPALAGVTVTAMADNALTDDAVDTSSLVEDGPFIVSPVTEFFSTLTAALNRMTALAGGTFRWRIDEYKRLVFSEFAATPALFDIAYPGNVSGSTWRELSYEQDMSTYRNEEFGRTESNINGTKIETFTGDGVQSDFFIGFVDPVSANPTRWMTDVPIITLDGAPLTVGRFGPDGIGDGFDCTYDVDGIGVHFLTAAGQTIPGVGQILSVEYQYTLGNVVSSSDAAQIAARQAIEGGSGKWQSVVEQRNISDGTTLQQIVQGDLAAYGKVAKRVRYETDEQGLSPGETQHVTLAYHDLDEDMIIDQIETQWLNSAPFQFRHKVTLTNIGPISKPEQMFEKLADTARIGVPRVSAVRTDLAGAGGGAFTFGGRQADGSSGNYLESEVLLTTLDGANGPWTISLWLKLANLTQSQKVIFQYSDLAGAFQCRLDFNMTAASQVAFFATNYTGSNPAPGSGLTIPNTGWHHICYRKNGVASSGWDCFLDGAKTVISGAINFQLSGNMQRAFAFADRENQFAPTRNLQGSIAEIAVWPTYALSDSQVAQIAAGTPANVVFASGLEDYWPISGSLNPEINAGGSTIGLDVHGTLPPA